MIISKKYSVMLGIVCSLFFSGNVSALQISQEEFSDHFKVNEVELVLMGAALQRFMVFKQVAVGLYLEKAIEKEELTNDIPWRVEIAYLQDVSKKEMIKSSDKGFADNLDKDKIRSLMEEFETLNSWYQDVEAGDRYAFTYQPGIGTQVDLNDVQLGVIEGADFARGFIAMYVGVKPLDNRSKRKLLGRLEFYQ